MPSQNEKTSQADEVGKSNWDNSYRVETRPALWCDDPVPFAKAAVKVFRDAGAVNTLELPCGDGKNTVYLSSQLSHLIAADTSPTALRIAQKRLSATGARNCVLCTTDVFATQFVEEQFDALFCCDLLGHLEQSNLALKALLRICRPGGLLVGNLFALGDSTRTAEHMVKIRDEEYIYRDKFYFRFFSDADVARFLESSFGEVISVELSRWMEGPHEGYREYPHEHQSWVFTVRKKGCT
jgi:ubiquinone/menaquinone biosynthesis C-methylase UbiE